jgi:hypothetical protein
MIQPGLYDDANTSRAEMRMYLSWNNGPFDDSLIHITCHLGSKFVFAVRCGTPTKETDFMEAFHIACREAMSQVIGHKVTNSHINAGRVVFGAPYQTNDWTEDVYHGSES